MKRFMCLAMFLMAAAAHAEQKPAIEWPQVFSYAEGEVTMYQPQIETVTANKITARAAVSVANASSPQPVFGAVWVEGVMLTDRNEGVATITSVTVTDAKAPDTNPEGLERFKTFLSQKLTEKQFVIPLDQLADSIAQNEKMLVQSSKVSVTPPKILFRAKPAAVLFIDGKMKAQPLPDTPYSAIVNASLPLLTDPAAKEFYLHVNNLWLRAGALEGPWARLDPVPAKLLELSSKLQDTDAKKPAADAVVPEVILTSSPSELFVTDGEIRYQPIQGTQLLVVANSDKPVFRVIDSQEIYVVIAGRWYKAASTDGPWTHVASDKLPADFAKIPEGSSGEQVLQFVAGTKQAGQAVLDASIPQTSAVKRGSVDLTVKYDGKPEFKKIEELPSVSYAVNTAEAVFRVGRSYYWCKDAVWYDSTRAVDGWEVTEILPKDLNNLPPSCPHYNCKFVTIYQVERDVVYVGYTPGYVGCYVAGPTVMYGTGYYYGGWYGSYYYPPAPAYGVGISVGIGIGVMWGWGMYGGYGYGYGSGYGHGYNDLYHNPNRPSGAPSGSRGDLGNRPSQLPAQGGGRGDKAQANRGDRASSGRPSQQPASNRGGAQVSDNMKNNVYADKQGNVYRQNDKGGWEGRSQNNWSSNMSADKASNFQRNQSDLNRQSQVRQQSGYRGGGGGYSGGGYRGWGYSGGGGYRGGGGGRGGGGRR